jgi:hypothetical protein
LATRRQHPIVARPAARYCEMVAETPTQARRTWTMNSIETRQMAARAFVRSLNILLKFAQLYGIDHARTNAHFETAWNELHTAIAITREAGLLLGARGSKLLLDGLPVEAAPAERSFAQTLTTAGLASIHFTSSVTKDDLERLVHAFHAQDSKPSALTAQLKSSLAGTSGIRIREARFALGDATPSELHKPPQPATDKRGPDAASLKDRPQDPQKTLQPTVLRDDSRSGPRIPSAGPDNGNANGRGNGAGTRHEAVPVGRPSGVAAGPDVGSRGNGAHHAAGSTAKDEEIRGILDLLNPLGHRITDGGSAPHAGRVQEKLAALIHQSRVMLREALAAIAKETSVAKSNGPTPPRQMVLATPRAAERAPRSEIKVKSVEPMKAHTPPKGDGRHTGLISLEEKPKQAVGVARPDADVMDRKFWEGVPETGKRAVLRSRDAWCIPARNIKLYIEELVGRGDQKGAIEILKNYASALHSQDREARRRTAIGLAELAGVYASAGEELLGFAIQVAATQLAVEREETPQSLIGTAFVRLAQEAGKRRMVPVMLQALDFLDSVERQRTVFAQSTRASIEFDQRVPEMLEEALRGDGAPNGLTPLLQRFPRATAGNMVARFNRAVDRTDWQRLVDLANAVGENVVSTVLDTLRTGPAAEAVETVGLLSRLDSRAIERWLPERLRDWPRSAQDRMVRLLSMAGSPERGRLLTHLLVLLDPVLLPLAIDEIGFADDASCAIVLLRMAEGNWPRPIRAFVRLKALEALGRLKPQLAAELLRRIAEARHMFHWAYPSELRLVAAQSLARMDRLWAREFLPRSGFSAAELTLATLDPKPDTKWLRLRRYPRVRLARPMPAIAAVGQSWCRLEIRGLSLSGGVAAAEKQLQPGALVSLRIGSGRHPIRAQVLLRDERSQGFGFEIADMDLEERARLRKLLLENAYPDIPDRQRVPTAPSV